jgi:hypothetical protein
MTTLTWTRERDGEHPNTGRPLYEYKATGKDGTRYNIVYAYDKGGQFGYSAYDTDDNRLSPGFPITWSRTLSFCKDECEKIERSRPAPAATLVPNYAGQFKTFDDWVNNATRALANRTCESSGATVAVPAICVDTKGRRCYQGSDFQRANYEGTFPVRYFWDCKPEA